MADSTQAARLVVGIGASAGGLEMLQELIGGLPARTGIAFGVLIHAPPDNVPRLVEFLARHTAMDLVPVTGEPVFRPDAILVFPSPRQLKAGKPHTIDDFFADLARRFGQASVGVVLSGTGTDGAAGAKAIETAGGTVLVQDPDTAPYASMPQSAADACARAERLAPDQLVERLLALANDSGRGVPAGSPEEPPELLAEEVREILDLVRARTGNDFTAYKTNTVLRRIDRRMKACGVTTIADYRALIGSSAEETQALSRDFSIGVTSFFRDAEAFEVLRLQVIPELCKGRTMENPVRVWDACCATGEEAYSIAILLRERLPTFQPIAGAQIFATDFDEEALAHARAGRFPESIAADVGAELLKRHFTRVDSGYQVATELREAIVFAKHNLLRDPPFSRLDLIVCRNFLIYLAPEVQQRILGMFHDMLRPGGILFLGSSETLGALADRYTALDKRWRIFRRIGGDARPDRTVSYPSVGQGLSSAAQERHAAAIREAAPAALAHKLLVARFAPPFVVVNERFEAIYFSPDINRFFEIPAGEPTRNILQMVRAELRPAVRAAVHKALAAGESATFRTQLPDLGGRTVPLDVKVEPLNRAAGRTSALVLFEPVPVPRATEVRPPAAAEGSADETAKDTLIRHLEEQLRLSQEDLNAAIEQLATSNDGLVSANEELMSINEEFQSTNEELETSKEELQTLNEELTTVNQELQRKVEALDRANSDIENLLDSTEIATLFLDGGLKVKRFTPPAAAIYHLISTDIGRPLDDLRGGIGYDGVPDDARRVLETGRPTEREVSSLDGTRHFLLRVLPYRAAEGRRIDGVVVTLIDLTERRRMEEALREQAQVHDLAHILVRDMDGRIVLWNSGVATLYGYTREQAQGRVSHELLRTRFPVPPAVIEAELHRNGSWEGELVHQTRDGRPITVQSHWVLYRDARGKPTRILETNADITDRKLAEERLRANQAFVRTILDSVVEGFVVVDRDRRVRATNEAYRRMIRSEGDVVGRPCTEVGQGALRACRDAGEPCPVCDVFASGQPCTMLQQDAGEDGATVYIETRAFPFRDATGAVVGVIETFTDVTGRHQLEEERLKSQKLEAIGTLAGGIAHDFNNLLQGLFGYISMARTRLDPADDASHMLAQAEQALQLATGLATQLLTFAKGGKPVRKLIWPAPLVERAVKFALSGSHVGCRLDFDPQLRAIEIDEGQIAQVIQNIVLNAEQAMPAGGVVEVTARNVDSEARLPANLPHGLWLAIAVRDTGRGIPADALQRIFDPYFTSKARGSGLGLATAYAIVHNHGGHIEVESEPGRGSTFTVYLPASEAKPPEEPAAERVTPGGGRILIMDDNALVRDVARQLVTALGYQADVSADGREAVTMYRAGMQAGTAYDVVILDITVRGGMGGKQALDELRALDPGVRAIASSGYSDDEVVANFAAHGFCASLLKPYTLKDLGTTLGAVLGRPAPPAT